MRRDWQIMALLAVATVAVFWQVSRLEFVNYDDPAYVTYNLVVREGLTWPGVVWAFTNLHGEATYWHPVTWLSHMLDCQLFGLRPAGHHLTNLFLHTVNTLLLFVVLRRMTGRRGASAMVAALFALHPLQVDSVAWVSERKNVLSTCFGFLCIWAYVHYAERAESRKQKAEIGRREEVRNVEPEGQGAGETALPSSTFDVQRSTFDVRPDSPSYLPSAIFYILSIVLFALCLMSKPAWVPLPLLLLLLDYWPLNRMQNAKDGGRRTEDRGRRTEDRRQKTEDRGQRTEDGDTQHATRNTQHVSRFTFHASLLIEKLPFLLLSVISSVVTIRSLSALGGLLGTRDLPVVLRFANAPVAYAIYLRKLFAPVDLSVFYLHPGRWPADTIVVSVLVLFAVTVVAVGQARRRPYLIVGWLWFLGMVAPVIGLVQAHLQAMADRFSYVPAIGLFIMVVWAAAEWLERRGSLSDHGLPLLGCAVAALVLAGCVVMTSLQLRYWRNSITLMQRVVQVEPSSYLARVMLGNALFERHELEGALRAYQAGLQLRPDYPDGWERAGVALTDLGRPAEALPYLQKAVQLAPAWPEPQRRLALAWLRQGRTNEAHQAYQRLAALTPATAEGRRDLADMLAEGHQFAEAVQSYQEALRLKPDFQEAMNNLAMLRASCPQAEFRNGAEAVQLAETACRLSERRNPSFLGTLAAAYAEAGRFGDAVKTMQEALAVSRASGANYLVPIQTQMLELFQAGKAYRQG